MESSGGAHSAAPALLPQPVTARSLTGPPWFPGVRVHITVNDEAARSVADLLADTLRSSLCAASVSVSLASSAPADPPSPPSSSPSSSLITLTLDPAGVPALDAIPGVVQEGYILDVRGEGVAASARSPAGLFYATQTFLQFFPPQPPSSSSFPPISLPPLSIADAPRFAWRGWLLDTSRHFFAVPWLCRAIEAAAALKLNVFHWHLTDDQGWRLEVEGYPRLTQVGAWRLAAPGAGGGGGGGGGGEESEREAGPDGGGGGGGAGGGGAGGGGRGVAPRAVVGGFYSAADVRAVVAFAAARGVTVVPEVDFPGHVSAALAAYPALACDPGRVVPGVAGVPAGWGVHAASLCAGSGGVLAFLDAVLATVMSLFPSRYVHIGGDERPSGAWAACPACARRAAALGFPHPATPAGGAALHAWLARRAGEALARSGRVPVAWDELAEDVAAAAAETGGDGGGPQVDASAALPPGLVVMGWRGPGPGARAARAGLPVIACPAGSCYLDYRQADDAGEPGAWYATLTLQAAWEFDPLATGDEGGVADGEGEVGCGPPAPPPPPPPLPPPLYGTQASEGGANLAGRRPMSTASGCGAEASPRLEREAGAGGGEPQPPAGDGEPAPTPHTITTTSAAMVRGASVSMIGDDGDGGGDDADDGEEGTSRPAPRPPTPPAAFLTGAAAARVLGGQANLWTEYVPDEATAEYMLWPRLAASAEALWSPRRPGGAGGGGSGGGDQGGRSWDGPGDPASGPAGSPAWFGGFVSVRLPAHLARLAAQGWRFRPLDE